MKEEHQTIHLPPIAKLVVIMLFWILLYFFLTTFRNFLYPVFLGIMFAYLLYPIAKFFEVRGIPRIPSNLIAIFIGIIVLGGSTFFIYKELQILLQDIPSLEAKANKNIDIIFSQIESQFGQISKEQEMTVKSLLSGFFDTGSENLYRYLSATAQTVFTIFIMPVYVFFLLYYRNKYFYFTMMLIQPKRHAIAEKTIRELSKVVKKYMSGIAIVVLILCFVNSLGLYVIGVKFALLFGIIAAVWNFIPYFGTIIGYSFPFVMALLTGDGPGTAIGVVILFVVVQFTENNILTPNITGGQVRVNPFFVILGVLIGNIVWGVPGMFIMVPVLAVIRIVCENIPQLKPWAYLIGDSGTEKHAISRKNFWDFVRRFYKSPSGV
jgi:predicted PurR-regulated permease PerM